MKKLRITVDGKVYNVTVESLDDSSGHASPAPPAAAPRAASTVDAPVSSASSSSNAGPAAAGAVVSPLAGRVVSVDCTIGAQVEAGQTLITLEAMKMNTLIHSTKAGRVSKILVQSGDPVEEGQALVMLDKP